MLEKSIGGLAIRVGLVWAGVGLGMAWAWSWSGVVFPSSPLEPGVLQAKDSRNMAEKPVAPTKTDLEVVLCGTLQGKPKLDELGVSEKMETRDFHRGFPSTAAEGPEIVAIQQMGLETTNIWVQVVVCLPGVSNKTHIR